MTGELKPGRKTALALDLMADLSSFLALPVNELPNNAPPDRTTQRSMISAAVDYTAHTLEHLPDFLATRATRSFDDSVDAMPDDGAMLAMHGDLRLVDSASQNITYRSGLEVAVARDGTTSREASSNGLWSTGEFGPTLATILLDASKGQVVWSHWEQTSTGLAGVFRYIVPQGVSTYHVNYCCTRDSGDNKRKAFHGTPGYHGFLAVDPATGAVLRYTLECDLLSSDPVSLTELAVQYGKILIGDGSYFCPIRSLAVVRGLQALPTSNQNTPLLSINEVTFGNYHRFGATLRVLPADPPQSASEARSPASHVILLAIPISILIRGRQFRLCWQAGRIFPRRIQLQLLQRPVEGGCP
jgi:hypothetical protein